MEDYTFIASEELDRRKRRRFQLVLSGYPGALLEIA